MLGKLAIIVLLVSIGLYVSVVRDYWNGPMCESKARIDGKTVIVTGSNTGIGKETVRDLVARGGKVIMACRSVIKCNDALLDIQKSEKVDSGRVYCMKLDLGSFKSIRQFVTDFNKKESRLDILINNAGTMLNDYSKTEDGLEIQIGINHFGHFLLTNLLLDKLKASAPSRIVTVSSLGHQASGINFDDIHFEKKPYDSIWGSFIAYGQSKTANILFAHQLAKELKGTGVTAYSLHPGSIKTDLQRHTSLLDFYHTLTSPFWKTIVHGAQTTICCAVDEKLAASSGKYYSDVAEKAPNAYAVDDENAKRLWDISMKTVGLNKAEGSTQT